MRKYIEEGWSAYSQGKYLEAAKAFRQVTDDIPFNSTGEQKQLLEEAMKGLYQLRFSTELDINTDSTDSTVVKYTDVLFQYKDWYERDIKEDIHTVFKSLAITSFVPRQDLNRVRKLFNVQLYKVCVIGPSDKTSLIKDDLADNTNLWVQTINIDQDPDWQKSLEEFGNNGSFNVIVISDGAPRDEVISHIGSIEALDGVPVLVFGSYWSDFDNTDRLMYSFKYLIALKCVIHWYCKASMVSKYLSSLFEPENITVLVTDDNRSNLLIASYVLKKNGYVAEVTSNNEETIKRMSEVSPSVVFTDQMRPDGDGYELFDRIRSDKRYKYLPIVLLSAGAGQGIRDIPALEKGFMTTIGKPMSINTFEGVVRQMAMLNQYMRQYNKIVDTE